MAIRPTRKIGNRDTINNPNDSHGSEYKKDNIRPNWVVMEQDITYHMVKEQKIEIFLFM